MLASTEPIGTLREPGIRCRQRYLLRYLLRVREDHMVCLELFLKIEIIPGMAKTLLGTMLSH